MANLINNITGLNTIEQLSEKKTIIHNIHPMSKIICTIAFIICTVSFHKYNVSGLVSLILYPVILIALSEIPIKTLFVRICVALPFSIFASISNIIFDRDVAISIGTIGISYGMISSLSIIIKTAFSVIAVLILVSTTTITDLSYQLVKLKVPSILILQITLTYRYFNVLAEESLVMFNSYILRSPNQKGIRLNHMGTFIGQLLLRSIERAEVIYYAMKCRGFNGMIFNVTNIPFHKKDGIYIIIIFTFIFIVRVFNISTFIGGVFIG